MGDVKKLIQEKEERLEIYKKAERKILSSQSYSIGSKSLTRADLGKVQAMIKELESEIESLKKRGTSKRRVARVIPID